MNIQKLNELVASTEVANKAVSLLDELMQVLATEVVVELNEAYDGILDKEVKKDEAELLAEIHASLLKVIGESDLIQQSAR